MPIIPNTKRKPAANTLTAGQQRRQASILLLRLQWLLILLLMIALVWLYVSQQRFQNQINERLQSNEQVVTRLNEMDDRLFAISQQTLPEPSIQANSQSQNQISLLRIQMQMADRLLADSNQKAAIELLQGLQWQLSQDSNEIAPALTIVIKQSLTKDIERLQAQSTQPSPWQLRSVAIQNIQAFLYSHEQDTQKKRTNSSALTRQQLTLHEVIMTLNLAIQASNMQEPELLTGYLRQAHQQLQSVAPDTVPSAVSKPSKNNQLIGETQTKETQMDTSASAYDLETIGTPNTLAQVLVWLDRLIVNEPQTKPLLTTQILEQPKS